MGRISQQGLLWWRQHMDLRSCRPFTLFWWECVEEMVSLNHWHAQKWAPQSLPLAFLWSCCSGFKLRKEGIPSPCRNSFFSLKPFCQTSSNPWELLSSTKAMALSIQTRYVTHGLETLPGTKINVLIFSQLTLLLAIALHIYFRDSNKYLFSFK